MFFPACWDNSLAEATAYSGRMCADESVEVARVLKCSNDFASILIVHSNA